MQAGQCVLDREPDGGLGRTASHTVAHELRGADGLCAGEAGPQLGKPFLLTPLETWYVLQGWEVAPAAGITFEQAEALPGKIEDGAGWVRYWQA